MSPDPADLPPVPGYQLLELLVRTGLTETYRARHVTSDREAAVQILSAVISSEGARRFLDGARIMASLAHPGVPPVHKVGELPDGRPFLAMKLVRGPTLDVLLEARPDPSADLAGFVRIFRQLCEVIGFAHRSGVLHQNIKPRSAAVCEDGEVLVVNWTLAAVGGASVTQEVRQRYPAREHSVAGTPTCMPPEQARGEQTDERSDVFGLGGVLCQILTGEPPFRLSATTGGLIAASAAGDLSDAFARLDSCDADPELVALCRRCLAPARRDRPADGTAVADAVAPLCE